MDSPTITFENKTSTEVLTELKGLKTWYTRTPPEHQNVKFDNHYFTIETVENLLLMHPIEQVEQMLKAQIGESQKAWSDFLEMDSTPIRIAPKKVSQPTLSRRERRKQNRRKA